MISLPWPVKYRPSTLKDIVGNEEVIVRLQELENTDFKHHFLFHGAPGVGKTTVALCLARQTATQKEDIMELNASDDRGMQVIRDRIIPFMNQKCSNSRRRFVILDEADSMTEAAQHALRPLLTKPDSGVTFILTGNDEAKILQSVRSRCVSRAFGKLNHKVIETRLQHVLQEEKLLLGTHYDEPGLQAVIDTANGDLRQALSNFHQTWIGLQCVTERNVYQIVDKPLPSIMLQVLDACVTNDLKTALHLVKQLRAQGRNELDIVLALRERVRGYERIEDRIQLNFEKRIGKVLAASHQLNFIQLTGLIASLSRQKVKLLTEKETVT